jgi:hypothetical protein
MRWLITTSSAAVLLAGFLGAAVVLDRIAVIVGNHAVKTSDIDRDLRLTEFLNRQPLNRSAAAKHDAAERLITQQIIRDEILSGGYRRPAESDADQLEAQLKRDRAANSDSRLRLELQRYGLTEAELHDQLLWQLTVLQFIDQRFRQEVQVSDADIRKYYDEHRAELRKQYPNASSFEALEPKIRSSLEGEAINQRFNEWLDQNRMRYRIQYQQGALE